MSESYLPDAACWLERPMSVLDARRVKKLRVEREMTWRELAGAFGGRCLVEPGWGNQLAGMDLHFAAMELLGESWE